MLWSVSHSKAGTIQGQQFSRLVNYKWTVSVVSPPMMKSSAPTRLLWNHMYKNKPLVTYLQERCAAQLQKKNNLDTKLLFINFNVPSFKVLLWVIKSVQTGIKEATWHAKLRKKKRQIYQSQQIPRWSWKSNSTSSVYRMYTCGENYLMKSWNRISCTNHNLLSCPHTQESR